MNYELKLTLQDLQIIVNALGLRPYTEVFNLISDIQKQVSAKESAEKIDNA